MQTKLAFLIMASALQLYGAAALAAGDSAGESDAAKSTSVAPESSALSVPMQVRGRVLRAQGRELILYVNSAQATIALELENSSGKVLSMAVASLMLGTCQTRQSTFRGLTQVHHKTPGDVRKHSGEDLRRVLPAEKFLLSISTSTLDLTCRTLAHAKEADVSLDLWVFDGNEGIRLPIRVPIQVQVARPPQEGR